MTQYWVRDPWTESRIGLKVESKVSIEVHKKKVEGA